MILLQYRVNGIVERDLDLMLKSHSALAGKDYIERRDFKNLFEVYIRQA